jgi:hypothetical protein
MHSMHVKNLLSYDLCMKMPPKRRTAGRSRTAQEVESLMLDYGTMQHSTPEDLQGYGTEQEMPQEGPVEVTMGCTFNRMVEILQNLAKRRAPHGEDMVLEQFLKFPPLTFFSEVEQEQ